MQGFDFLVLDGEHGTMKPADCENMVRGADVRGVPALVRVPANEAPVILRFMDTGALGVHVDRLSAEDADRAVRAVKYGPRGGRGLTGVRAAAYGQRGPLAEYVERANAETLVVVQIETRAALEQVTAIAAVDGVDIVFVGPTDLSHSLGVPGQTSPPARRGGLRHDRRRRPGLVRGARRPRRRRGWRRGMARARGPLHRGHIDSL